MQQPETNNEMFARRRGKARAVLLCTSLAIFAAATGYKHWFNDRHTSRMQLETAIAELRSGKLNADEARIALRIVKNHALQLIDTIKSDTGEFADSALHCICEAAKR